MPAKRVSMRRVREILRLKHECGVTDQGIARSLSVARSTIALTLERVAAGLGWPFPATLADRVLDAMLYASTAVSRARVERRSPIALMASSPAPAIRVETRCVRTSKTEAFDGKEGRAADGAAEPVPGGHTLAPP